MYRRGLHAVLSCCVGWTVDALIAAAKKSERDLGADGTRKGPPSLSGSPSNTEQAEHAELGAQVHGMSDTC